MQTTITACLLAHVALGLCMVETDSYRKLAANLSPMDRNAKEVAQHYSNVTLITTDHSE